MPIKAACFHVSCRVLESIQKKRRRKQAKLFTVMDLGKSKTGNISLSSLLPAAARLALHPPSLLPKHIHTNTCTFSEMCLQKIRGLFPIALITPFLICPCVAHDCRQVIVWSSPACSHRRVANVS